MEKKEFTFRELKEAVNKLTDEQLEQSVVVYREESGVRVAGLDEEQTDRYVYINDPEDTGTLEELKERHGDEFVLEDYYLIPKGRPFLWEEF